MGVITNRRRRDYINPGLCLTRGCNEELKPFARVKLCPSCRWAWGWGGAIGGVLFTGLIKLAEHFLR